MAATVFPGLETGYTGAWVKVRQLEGFLDILEPMEFPLLQAVGLDTYEEEIFNTKVEWQYDYLVPSADSINVGGGIDDSQTTATVLHASYFALHDVVKAESELIRVVEINTSTNVLTVERGFAGTTEAAHADDTVLQRLGSARPEGSGPGWAQQVATVQPYNYTQIWDNYAEISGTQEQIAHYGPEAILDERVSKRMREMMMMMEQSFMHGIRYEPATNTGRMAGGLNQFITDARDIGAVALELETIGDAMEDVALRVGQNNVPKTIWGNTWLSRKVSSWGVDTIRTERGETAVGNAIRIIDTDFGSLAVQFDHLIDQGTAYMLSMDRLSAGPLRGRGFASYRMSINADLIDADRERLLGEYTFIVKGEDGTNKGTHVRLYNFSTSS